MIRFNEICETTQGVQISKANQVSEPLNGYERYLYISDLLHDKNLKYIKNEFPHKIVTEDDLVVANTGSPGKVFKGKHGILSNNLFRLSFDSKTANRDYLYFILSSETFQNSLQKQMKGGIQKHLGHKTMGKQKIPLPPLDQQKKIAAILDAADAYRQKTKALIKKYDELTQSLFLDMFGDPVSNPKGWEITLLSDACSKITDGTHDTPERLKEGVKFITGKHIRPYVIDYDNCDYVDKDVHDIIFRRCNPELGDVLYTNIGVNLGTAAVNKVKYEFSMKNVALLKPKMDLIIGRYIEYFLNSENMKKKIVWIGSLGGAQQFLSLTLLRRLKINLPPLELQNQFAERVKVIESQKAQAQASLAQAEDLFNSLLQRAFKGELV